MQDQCSKQHANGSMAQRRCQCVHFHHCEALLQVVTDPWLRRFIDLECFVLSGMPAKDTITAEMAFMFMERNKADSTIDYPMGGSEAIIGALVRGIEKRGGRLLLRSHVEQILVEGGKATGVRLAQRGSKGPQNEVRLLGRACCLGTMCLLWFIRFALWQSWLSWWVLCDLQGMDALEVGWRVSCSCCACTRASRLDVITPA